MGRQLRNSLAPTAGRARQALWGQRTADSESESPTQLHSELHPANWNAQYANREWESIPLKLYVSLDERMCYA
jgi:hypothetical protein